MGRFFRFGEKFDALFFISDSVFLSCIDLFYEAVFKPLKPLISKELAVFLLHGWVFSQGVFRGCSRFYEHGVFRVFRGVFTVRGVQSVETSAYFQCSFPALFCVPLQQLPIHVRLIPVCDSASCKLS